MGSGYRANLGCREGSHEDVSLDIFPDHRRVYFAWQLIPQRPVSCGTDETVSCVGFVDRFVMTRNFVA
jgi:hypothetical protein